MAARQSEDSSQAVRGRHVAIVVTSLEAGGAQRVALNLANAFQEAGVRTDLVLVSEVAERAYQPPPGIRVVALRRTRARQAVRALRDYIRRERPDAILAVAFQNNLLAALASRWLRPRPRLILSVHSTLSRAFAGHSPLRRHSLRLATRWLYRGADHVVAVSAGAARDLAQGIGVDPARIGIVYNPVVSPEVEEGMREVPAHPWAADRSIPLIITVGRLTAAKDCPTLLRAFAEVRRRREARLVVVGEGELRTELEDLARALGVSDSVAFAGFQANPWSWMRAADLFVLSSSWEGFGNVLVEAMATGTPVVSTDCPHGPREILEDGRWGALVPPGNPPALAAAILEALETGGIDARERARVFTVERAAEQYLELLLGRGDRVSG